jgi:predicted nucleic acid-binding protein
MILVDTSIWVSHLRDGHPELKELLLEGKVVCHPFVIGELACGNLQNRREILRLLKDLPMAQQASDEEFLCFIETNRLMGLGLGLIDVHLLASALLSGISLWTLDSALKKAAIGLGVSLAVFRE